MDYLFLELIGKPILNPPKTITVVAENFGLLEDQARFLKATLAIPTVKQLPFNNASQRLIQIGPIHREIGNQVKDCRLALNHYEELEEGICDKIEADLSDVTNRSIIFVNDVSKLELMGSNSIEAKKMLILADKLKRLYGHFVVLLYQGSESTKSIFLRDLTYLSDAVVEVKSCKAGYFKSIWWQTIPQHKTLIPSKIETNYFTCKIGKNYYSSDFLCFYDRKKVQQSYDIEKDIDLSDQDESNIDRDSENIEDEAGSNLGKISDDKYEDTLPFTNAQDPEQSRIFYYPDKDDDIDEDDPDNDLGI